MSRTIIYDTNSRAILVLDPQVGSDGKPVLPVHVATAAVATITDAEATKFATAASAFSLAADNVSVIVTAVVQPPAPLRDAVIAAAQSAAGVTLSNLTQAQRLSLVACLLYRAGGLDPVTLAVRPLEQWLT